MYFFAISSIRSFTSRANCRRKGRRFSSSVSSRIRRKFSRGNLASTATSRSPIRIAASTFSPLPPPPLLEQPPPQALLARAAFAPDRLDLPLEHRHHDEPEPDGDRDEHAGDQEGREIHQRRRPFQCRQTALNPHGAQTCASRRSRQSPDIRLWQRAKSYFTASAGPFTARRAVIPTAILTARERR